MDEKILNKINRWYIIVCWIFGLSLALSVVLLSFLPILPAGFVEGKTPAFQMAFIYLNPKIYLVSLSILIIIAAVSLMGKRYIKKKYKKFIF